MNGSCKQEVQNMEKVNMCGAIAALVAEGEMKGMERGISALIETCKEFDISKEDTFSKIRDKFEISEEETENFMNKYWTEHSEEK